MGPWQDAGTTKALPARPDSDSHRRGSVLNLDDDLHDAPDEAPLIQTATLTRILRDDSRSPLPPQTLPPPPPQRYQDHSSLRDRSQDTARSLRQSPGPEHGLLQSSFSRSPVRLRSPVPPHQQESRDQHYVPPPLSPFRPPSPPKQRAASGNEGPIRSDFSLPADARREPRQTTSHVREASQNSWLDPIDESGGSSGSSVHSRTSSLGFRRKHIRHASGDTVAEFDTALDAAIEAAYDDGYEPAEHTNFETSEPGEEIIANALRKVEIARERVRQTELEAYGVASDRERPRLPQQHEQQQQQQQHRQHDFYDDNSSDDEERMLEEMTRGYAIEDFAMDQRTQPSVPRESDSSGMTTRTWHSSMGSNPATGATSLSTVTEAIPLPNLSKSTMPSGPPPPPPTKSPPDLPQQRPSSAGQSVRNRRLSGQNPKQLKIETTKLGPPGAEQAEDVTRSRSATSGAEEQDYTSGQKGRPAQPTQRPLSPQTDASPFDGRALASPFGHRGRADAEEGAGNGGRSASPSVSKMRKNFSSSSLKSMKSRNMSLSNLDDASDMSPGTPSSNQFNGSRAPAIPALPTPLPAAFRERMDATSTGGLFLFDDNFHSPDSPGSPNPMSLDAPVALEPCPTDFMLRPFWLMRCLYQTLAHPRGGYLSTKLFVPRDVWRVKGVKLKNIEDKVANCDFLTAALLKLAKVDTFDADAVLEEMQSLEGVLEQTQAALTRKLGNEVGVQGSGTLFKDASSTADADGGGGVPRSASVSGKSSSFSWRRLRSKNSAVGLGGSFNSRSGSSADGNPEATGLPTLPMTVNPTSRPVKRDVGLIQFTGPNAHYMASLARLFDAAQAVGEWHKPAMTPALDPA